MLPDRVLNQGPLTYESGVLPIALRGPATLIYSVLFKLCCPEKQTGNPSSCFLLFLDIFYGLFRNISLVSS